MEDFVGSNNDRRQQMVIRGKRTKRQRPASPFGTCSSSSAGGGDHYCGSTSSPTTSGGEVYESTEEEEDMANCLILLAQGGGAPVRKDVPVKMQQQERCSSRKFSEIMAATSATAGKVGFYVYECKTCNRTFPSFQALGGHRASHKKPKTATATAVAVVEEKKAAVTANSIPTAIPMVQSSTITTDHDQFDDVKFNKNCQTSPLSLQFANHNHHSHNNSNKSGFQSNNNKSNKIHECSICGSEFTSGQALGGHMRRHRAAAAAASATTATPTTAVTSADTSATDHHHHQQHQHHRGVEEKKTRNILQLDLNLPAPEDDLRESAATTASKFQFSSAKQSIVFSAPALVDCHY